MLTQPLSTEWQPGTVDLLHADHFTAEAEVLVHAIEAQAGAADVREWRGEQRRLYSLHLVPNLQQVVHIPSGGLVTDRNKLHVFSSSSKLASHGACFGAQHLLQCHCGQFTEEMLSTYVIGFSGNSGPNRVWISLHSHV
jgi:hypothetical protein